ncbi:MAG: thiamine pyrophosphate-dependent enzyme [Verrucomicrobiota bacterium]
MGKLKPNEKLRILHAMVQARESDRREGILSRQGKGWFQIGSMGHEALGAIATGLGQDDYIFPHYRDKALVFARGLSVKEVALGFFAKRESSSGGRQLPGHFSSREHHVWSMPSPTGSNLLPACGVAWGMRLDGHDDVVIACVGDAGMRQGEFYEAVAFAHQMQLPVVFVVEDNQMGISTETNQTNPLRLGLFNQDIVLHVNGRSVDDVFSGASMAIHRVRSKEGPCILWCELDRLCSHSSSDDQRIYRKSEEIDAMFSRDPIEELAAGLVQDGELTEKSWEQWHEEIQNEVVQAYEIAENSIDPQPSETMAEVIAPVEISDEVLFDHSGADRMLDAVNRVFHNALSKDRRTIFFGEDVQDPLGGVFKLTTGLSTDYPDRVFNSPLAEATIIGVGCGLASYGMRPVFELQFIDFVGPAWNQIVTNLSTLRWRTFGDWTCPMVVYAPYGAYLPGGGPWHSQSNESAFAHVPGIRVVVPSNPTDAAGLVQSAMQAEDPTIVLLPKHLLRVRMPISDEVKAIPFGKARQMREGWDLTLVCWGNTVEKAEEALQQMEGSVSVDWIDLRSIQPWDKDAILESVKKTGRLLIVQEDNRSASIGQMIIAEVLGNEACWSSLQSPPRLLAREDVHIGFHPNYEESCLPSGGEIAQAIFDLVYGQADQPRLVSNTSSDRNGHSGSNGADASTEDHDMKKIPIKVPAIGEGLEEARILKFFKSPGDAVQRDELIYQLETDKAVVDIEAPHAGTLTDWAAEEDATVSIGATIGHIEADIEGEIDTSHEKGNPMGAMYNTPSEQAMIDQVQAKLSEEAPSGYEEIRLSDQQQILAGRLTRAARVVVPATIFQKASWSAISEAREKLRANPETEHITSFALATRCIVNAIAKHEVFRSSLPRHSMLRIYEHVHLGVAVSLPDDDLTTAVVDNADTYDLSSYAKILKERVKEARDGEDQVRHHTSVIVTSLTAMDIRDAIPVIVPPAMATLALSSPYEELSLVDGEVVSTKYLNLSLTIDHRVVNGARAASFLNDVRYEMEHVSLPDELVG